MCTGIVRGLAEHTGVARDQVNILPGWVEPSDMREIKRIARDLGANIVLFPDTSDVVDTPQTGEYVITSYSIHYTKLYEVNPRLP